MFKDSQLFKAQVGKPTGILQVGKPTGILQVGKPTGIFLGRFWIQEMFWMWIQVGDWTVSGCCGCCGCWGL